MPRAEVINITLKKEDQIRDEMNMTPMQRIELVFQLMDLAIAISPNNEIALSKKDDIPWIELKLKNDFA